MNSVPELQELETQRIPTSETPVKLPVEKLEDTSPPKTETIEESIIPKITIESKPVEPEVVEERPKETVVDPNVIKFRKMLQFGVPRGAVELKMLNEGFDPKLL